MALSRREFQLLTERVGKLEAQLRAVQEQLKVLDNKLKPENLHRALRHYEEDEKHKADSPPIL